MNRLAELVDAEWLLLLGLALAAAGLVAWFAPPPLRAEREAAANRPAAGRTRPAVLLALAAIVAGGAWLRIAGLDEKSLNHTEIYVPGVPLPPEISEPPPRHGLAETVSWHFHVEPHPQGYYYLGWMWTKLFGASAFALRLPSALFGVAAIVLVWRLATLAAGASAGLLAAAMMALHGLQIFWSQMARMYAMTTFLGLASTLLLVALAQSPGSRRGLELAYLTTAFWGVLTEILFWPLLAAQMLWTAVALRRPAGGPDRLLRVQALTVMLGAPLWAHAVYRSREIDLGAPWLAFLRDYLSFGFLYEPDGFAVAPVRLPGYAAWTLLAAAVALYAAARPRPLPAVAPRDGRGGGLWATAAVAAGSALFTLGLALLAHRRRETMALAAGLPIAALAAPGLLAASADRLAASRAGRALGAAALHPLSLVATLALVPPALVFAVALWFPLLQSRLFLVFTPYLLVLAAAGAAVIARTRRLAVALAVGLLAVHAGSAALAPGRLSTPREYKRLGADLERAYRPGDLVFARHRHWATTPLFYYLDRSRAALVTRHFGRALRDHRAPRVFVVIPFRDGRMHRAMRHALAGYEMVGVLRRLNNRVEIYAPAAPAAHAAAPGEE